MEATPIVEMQAARWDPALSAAEQAAATASVESGSVLFFPRLAFELEPGERRYLSPHWCAPGSKNISLDPATGGVRGAAGSAAELEALGKMIGRFARCAHALIEALFPDYRGAFTVARTSFRPVEV